MFAMHLFKGAASIHHVALNFFALKHTQSLAFCAILLQLELSRFYLFQKFLFLCCVLSHQ